MKKGKFVHFIRCKRERKKFNKIFTKRDFALIPNTLLKKKKNHTVPYKLWRPNHVELSRG